MPDQQQALLAALEQVPDFDRLLSQIQADLQDEPSLAGEIAERAVSNACSSPSMNPVQDILDSIDNEFLVGRITLQEAEGAEAWLLALLEGEE